MSRTFHVSPEGNDANPGTRAAPWKTVGRVNQAELRPGDSVLFEGAEAFEGTLKPVTSGEAGSPIVYGTFGGGRAQILAGAESGIVVSGPLADVTIQDLILTGDWSTRTDSGESKATGVFFENPHFYQRIKLVNLDVSGFGAHGILVWGASDRFVIEGCQAHHNRHDGIVLRPQNWITKGHTRAKVSECWAFYNTGLSTLTTEHSGSGILMGGVDGGIVERCVAHNNGWRCASLTGGPVGIWMWMSNDVKIVHCESHHNANNGPNDGGGFDIDGGCTNCVIEGCYAHENEGPGILVAAYPGGGALMDNAIRGNVSLYDCSKPSRGGGLDIWNGLTDESGMQRTTIEGNLFACLYEAGHSYGTPTTDTVIRGNRFLLPRGRRVLSFAVIGPGFVLEGNRYFTRGGRVEVEFGRILCRNFSMLKKLKQEKEGVQEKAKIMPLEFPRMAPTLDDVGAVQGFVEGMLAAHLGGWDVGT